jgi:hypothetical protein
MILCGSKKRRRRKLVHHQKKERLDLQDYSIL